MDYSDDAQSFYLDEQNKKKQKELKEKYGMDFQKGETELPPEIENQFLNNVEKFEEAWENAESKKIIEIIGNPVFKKTDDLSKEQIPDEIEKILKLYNEHSINIDVIEKDDVSDEDFHRFLTEELPLHETDLVPIGGMTTNFIYEEFHPSNKLDAKDAIEWFSWRFFAKNEEDVKTYLAKENLRIGNEVLTQSEFINICFSMMSDVGEVLDKEIIFKNFEFSDEINKVYADFIFRYVQLSTNKEVDRILSFCFELERSEYGGFDIKGYVLE
ncbi:MAG: hypothetical protein V1720_03400 [bacterium]